MFEEFLSIDGYALRLVQSSGWNFNWFEHIPEKVRTKELYEYVIQNHGALYFKSLPDLYKTKTLSIEAFGKYGSKILPHVPNATFDQDFCEKILAKDIAEIDPTNSAINPNIITLITTNTLPENTNCSGLNFSYLYLNKAQLKGVNLSGANLSGADLTRADFTGAELSGANLSGAYLAGADFTDAIFNKETILSESQSL
jgi:hypothetical protein